MRRDDFHEYRKRARLAQSPACAWTPQFPPGRATNSPASRAACISALDLFTVSTNSASGSLS